MSSASHRRPHTQSRHNERVSEPSAVTITNSVDAAVAGLLAGALVAFATETVYGLGALAMCGGSSLATFMILSWPTGEFGPMGLEGGVKLGYRKELLAIEDPAQRKAWFDMMVAKAYEENKALSSATFMEVDDVIDPVDTRRRILRGLKSIRPRERGLGKKVSSLDVW